MADREKVAAEVRKAAERMGVFLPDWIPSKRTDELAAEMQRAGDGVCCYDRGLATLHAQRRYKTKQGASVAEEADWHRLMARSPFGCTARELSEERGPEKMLAWLFTRVGARAKEMDVTEKLYELESCLAHPESPFERVTLKLPLATAVAAMTARLAPGTLVEDVAFGNAEVMKQPCRRLVSEPAGKGKLPEDAARWMSAVREELRTVWARKASRCPPEQFNADKFVKEVVQSVTDDAEQLHLVMSGRVLVVGDTMFGLRLPEGVGVDVLAEFDFRISMKLQHDEHQVDPDEAERGLQRAKSIQKPLPPGRTVAELAKIVQAPDCGELALCLAACSDVDHRGHGSRRKWYLRPGDGLDKAGVRPLDEDLMPTGDDTEWVSKCDLVAHTIDGQFRLWSAAAERVALQLDAVVEGVLANVDEAKKLKQRKAGRRGGPRYDWCADALLNTEIRLKLLFCELGDAFADVQVINTGYDLRGRGLAAGRHAIAKGERVARFSGDLAPAWREGVQTHRIGNLELRDPKAKNADVEPAQASAMLCNSAYGGVANAKIVSSRSVLASGGGLEAARYYVIVATGTIQPGEEIRVVENSTELPVLPTLATLPASATDERRLAVTVLDQSLGPVDVNARESMATGVSIRPPRSNEGFTMHLDLSKVQDTACYVNPEQTLVLTRTPVTSSKVAVVNASGSEERLVEILTAVGAEWALNYATDLGNGSFMVPQSLAQKPVFCNANGAQTLEYRLSSGAVKGKLVKPDDGPDVLLEVKVVDLLKAVHQGCKSVEVLVDYGVAAGRLVAGDELEQMDKYRQLPTLMAASIGARETHVVPRRLDRRKTAQQMAALVEGDVTVAEVGGGWMATVATEGHPKQRMWRTPCSWDQCMLRLRTATAAGGNGDVQDAAYKRQLAIAEATRGSLNPALFSAERQPPAKHWCAGVVDSAHVQAAHELEKWLQLPDTTIDSTMITGEGAALLVERVLERVCRRFQRVDVEFLSDLQQWLVALPDVAQCSHTRRHKNPSDVGSIVWLAMEPEAVTQLAESKARLELVERLKNYTVICSCDRQVMLCATAMGKMRLGRGRHGVGIGFGQVKHLDAPSGEDVPADVSIPMIESYASLLRPLRPNVEVYDPIDARVCGARVCHSPRRRREFAKAMENGKSGLAVLVAPGPSVTVANHRSRLLRGDGSASDADDWVLFGPDDGWTRTLPWTGLAYRVVFADAQRKVVHVFDASGDRNLTATTVWETPQPTMATFAGGFLSKAKQLFCGEWKTRLHTAHEVPPSRQGLWVTAVLKMLLAYDQGERGYDVALQHGEGSIEQVERELHTGKVEAGHLPPTLVSVPKLPIKLGEKQFEHSIPADWIEDVTTFARHLWPNATVISHVGRRKWTWPDKRLLQICGGGTKNGRRYLQVQQLQRYMAMRDGASASWASDVWLRLQLCNNKPIDGMLDFMDHTQLNEFEANLPAIVWLDGSQSREAIIRDFISSPACIGTTWSPRRGVGTALFDRRPGDRQSLMTFMLAMHRLKVPLELGLLIVHTWHDTLASEWSAASREWRPFDAGRGTPDEPTLDREHPLYDEMHAMSARHEAWAPGASGFTCTDESYGQYRDHQRPFMPLLATDAEWIGMDRGADLQIAGLHVPNGFHYPPAPLLTASAADLWERSRDAALHDVQRVERHSPHLWHGDAFKELPTETFAMLAILQRLGLAPLGKGPDGQSAAVVIKYHRNMTYGARPVGGSVLMYPLEPVTESPVEMFSGSPTEIWVGKHVAAIGWDESDQHRYTGEGYALMIRYNAGHAPATYPMRSTDDVRAHLTGLGFTNLVQPAAALRACSWQTSSEAVRLANDEGTRTDLKAHEDDVQVIKDKLGPTLAAIGRGPRKRKLPPPERPAWYTMCNVCADRTDGAFCSKECKDSAAEQNKLWKWLGEVDMQQVSHIGDATLLTFWEQVKAITKAAFFKDNALVDTAWAVYHQYLNFSGPAKRARR